MIRTLTEVGNGRFNMASPSRFNKMLTVENSCQVPHTEVENGSMTKTKINREDARKRELLRVVEVADLLGESRANVYLRLKRGEIKGVKFGKTLRVHRSQRQSRRPAFYKSSGTSRRYQQLMSVPRSSGGNNEATAPGYQVTR